MQPLSPTATASGTVLWCNSAAGHPWQRACHFCHSCSRWSFCSSAFRACSKHPTFTRVTPVKSGLSHSCARGGQQWQHTCQCQPGAAHMERLLDRKIAVLCSAWEAFGCKALSKRNSDKRPGLWSTRLSSFPQCKQSAWQDDSSAGASRVVPESVEIVTVVTVDCAELTVSANSAVNWSLITRFLFRVSKPVD